MNNFKRIFSVALTVTLILCAMVSALNVSAATVYRCELGVNKTKDGPFEFFAYEIASQKFYPLESEAKATWSPDWPGHFVPGTEVYTVSRSERENEGALIDLMCDGVNNWGSVVSFTAPKAGKYHVSTSVVKFSGETDGLCCYVDIMLVKGDGTILFKEEKVGYGEFEWVKKNFQLAEGEALYILVVPNAASTKTSSQNVALKTFVVSEAQEQTTLPGNTADGNNTSGNDTAPDNTTAPNNNGGNNNHSDDSADKVNPLVLVAIVGGVLILTVAAVVIVAVDTKKKSKK